MRPTAVLYLQRAGCLVRARGDGSKDCLNLGRILRVRLPTRSYSLSREGFKKLLNVQNSPQQEEIRYGSSIRTTSIRSLRHVFEGSPLVAEL
jgi:hypothetical protein